MPTRSQCHQDAVDDLGSRMDSECELTDKQWELIADLFPWEPPASEGGRPQVHPRDCLEGILWVLRTGARWKDLPKTFPSKSTCHLRLKTWTEAGLLEQAFLRLVMKLDENEQIDFSETFADGTFSSAKKGAKRLDRHVAAKARKSCSWWMPRGFHSRFKPSRPIETKRF